MRKSKKVVKTPEELEKEAIERQLSWCLDHLKFARNRPIVRKFEIGEEVIYGGFHKTVIIESLEGGLYYKIGTTSAKKDYSDQITYIQSETFVAWHDLIKKSVNKFNFSNEDAVRLNFGQTDLEGLLSRYHHFGVDLEVDYQRGYVWSQEDKESLIESLLVGCDIGKMVFVRRPFTIDGPLYEILDGKQRYSTLLDFVEDQITYKGFKFSDLSFQDRYTVRRCLIQYTDIQADSYDKKQILEIFYRLNRHGKIMDRSHLETVKKMIDDLKRE